MATCLQSWVATETSTGLFSLVWISMPNWSRLLDSKGWCLQGRSCSFCLYWEKRSPEADSENDSEFWKMHSVMLTCQLHLVFQSIFMNGHYITDCCITLPTYVTSGKPNTLHCYYSVKLGLLTFYTFFLTFHKVCPSTSLFTGSSITVAIHSF